MNMKFAFKVTWIPQGQALKQTVQLQHRWKYTNGEKTEHNYWTMQAYTYY